jgi:hypothetical protein
MILLLLCDCIRGECVLAHIVLVLVLLSRCMSLERRSIHVNSRFVIEEQIAERAASDQYRTPDISSSCVDDYLLVNCSRIESSFL